MNENVIHRAPKRLRMENCTKQSLRIAPNSKVEEMNENAIHGAPKRLRMENFTKQSLRIAPNSKVEDT